MSKFKIPTEEKFVKKFLIAVFLLISVTVTGTLFLNTGQMTYSESFLKTIELITHVDAEHMEHKFLSITLSLIGYVVQFYILYVLLEFTLEGKLRNIFTEVKTLKNINKMKDHYIICGGGRVGRNVANELIKEKKKYVIIEAEEQVFKRLKANNYVALNIDALDETELEKAGILKASWLIACLGDDGDNILLVLSAKEANPQIEIAARANHERIIKKLKHAGAVHIVMPEVLGGINLAKKTLGKDIGMDSLDLVKSNPLNQSKNKNNPHLKDYGIDLA